MSELKITISQLEDLLDRQRESIIDYMENEVFPATKTADGKNLFTQDEVINACNKANYPHDFSILKRYVK